MWKNLSTRSKIIQILQFALHVVEQRGPESKRSSMLVEE
jgi:hypothetical protein